MPDMAAGRWYPTNTALANGEQLVVAGAREDKTNNLIPEIWSPSMRLWRRLAELDDRAYGEFLVLTLFSPQFIAVLGAEGVREAVAGTLPHPGTSRQIELNATVDIRADAVKITAPTLLVGGAYDTIVPPTAVQELAKLIVGSTYSEVDSGHMVLVEQPEKVLSLIGDFLE